MNFFNPSVIVIGGDLGEAHEQLLAGVREVIFERSLPLATRDLRTEPSRLGDRAGVVGAAIMVIEHVLAPDVVDRALQGAAAAGRRLVLAREAASNATPDGAKSVLRTNASASRAPYSRSIPESSHSIESGPS